LLTRRTKTSLDDFIALPIRDEPLVPQASPTRLCRTRQLRSLCEKIGRGSRIRRYRNIRSGRRKGRLSDVTLPEFRLPLPADHHELETAIAGPAFPGLAGNAYAGACAFHLEHDYI